LKSRYGKDVVAVGPGFASSKRSDLKVVVASMKSAKASRPPMAKISLWLDVNLPS
jgi:hypothetical protein